VVWDLACCHGWLRGAVYMYCSVSNLGIPSARQPKQPKRINTVRWPFARETRVFPLLQMPNNPAAFRRARTRRLFQGPLQELRVK
jgi:hypothetical protein